MTTRRRTRSPTFFLPDHKCRLQRRVRTLRCDAMADSHSIRLRGPWEIASLTGSGDVAAGTASKIDVPGDWVQASATTSSARPATPGVSTAPRISKRTSGCGSFSKASTGGPRPCSTAIRSATCFVAGEPARFDVTTALAPHNTLEVDVSLDRAAFDDPPSRGEPRRPARRPRRRSAAGNRADRTTPMTGLSPHWLSPPRTRRARRGLSAFLVFPSLARRVREKMRPSLARRVGEGAYGAVEMAAWALLESPTRTSRVTAESTHPMLHLPFACVVSLLFAPGATAGEPNTLSPAELDDGWILLFDGQSDFRLEGRQPGELEGGRRRDLGERRRKGAAGHDQRVRRLRAEARLPRSGDDQQRRLPAHAARAHESGGRLLRAEHRRAGGQPVCHRQLRQPPEGRERAGERRLADIRRSRPRAATSRSGSASARCSTTPIPSRSPRGRIGLQFNSGPVAFRNIKLKPLALEVDLQRPRPDRLDRLSRQAERILGYARGSHQRQQRRPASWSTRGCTTISCCSWRRSPRARSSTRAFFFAAFPARCGKATSARFKTATRTATARSRKDCGTGGFFRRQNARRVVSNDFEWFHLTLAATGPHMAAWVDGYPVSDWTDPRPPHENPRQGQRLQAGTLEIQGHDKTTNLSFRRLRVGKIPPR